MFFNKKSEKCSSCKSKVGKDYSFCPYCGSAMRTKEEEAKEFGMLGRTDLTEREMNNIPMPMEGMGLTDKIIGSLVNNLMKSLDKQFKELDKSEVTSMPNGIKIRIGPPVVKSAKQVQQQPSQKIMTSEQIKKMTSFPRANAKTSIRRFSDKVVYEIKTPGIESNEDVFISKLENGYEIKALGNKKIYVNNIPIDLPIGKYIVQQDKVLVEFPLDDEMQMQ